MDDDTEDYDFEDEDEDNETVEETVSVPPAPSPLSTPDPEPTDVKFSISQLADQVEAGQWGDRGPERDRALRVAGYSATKVQAEINRRRYQAKTD